MSHELLTGVRVVTIAVNLPGPVAAARLTAMGATVTKVEPPTGDPVTVVPALYAELTSGQQVVTLDLKQEGDRAQLDELLAEADVFVTSHRTSALERLGLGWPALHERHPRLCQVAIVGHPAPEDDVPGHDLTYQAGNGMLSAPVGETPQMPVVLVADLAGAERAASAALAALVARARTGVGTRVEVALSDAAAAMALPLRHGMTRPGGVLNGAHPGYGIYPSADGHIAVAALEPHFFHRLLEELGVIADPTALAAAFVTRTSADWVAWGHEHDVPIEQIADI